MPIASQLSRPPDSPFRPSARPFFLTNRPHPRSLSTSPQDPHHYQFWDPRWTQEYAEHKLPSAWTSSPIPGHQSWFTTKHLIPNDTSTEDATVYKMVHESGTFKKAESLPAVRKIRIFPTTSQKIKLKQMAGTTRYLYNHVTAMIRDRELPFECEQDYSAVSSARAQAHEEKGYDRDYKETAHPWLNFIYMRNFLVHNQSSFVQDRPWMKDTPNSVRQIAVREAIANVKAALTNQKRGNIKHFDMPFRRKKSRSWSIGVDPTQLKNNKLFPGGDFGFLKVAEPEFLEGRYSVQPRIQRDKYMRFFLILTIDPNQRRDRFAGLEYFSEVTKPIIAIDPGIRTRHVMYSTQRAGEIIEFGKGDIERIVRLAKFVDKRISESQQSGCNHKRRRRLLKQRLKLTARIAALKTEMDYQTIRYLERNASRVLLPTFETHQMACRLRHKTARRLMCWGHGLFKQRLLDRARRCDLEVMLVSEHYTSKTCGSCGRVDNNLGGKKMYNCRRCGFRADRDHNGARNILLRALRQA